MPTAIVGSGEQYPPLQQAMVDPQTGLVTREWARWFLWVAQASNRYNNLDTDVLLGRGSAADGPAVPITLGTGLSMVDNVLTLDP